MYKDFPGDSLVKTAVLITGGHILHHMAQINKYIIKIHVNAYKKCMYTFHTKIGSRNI